jgi:Lamin Tail Domain
MKKPPFATLLASVSLLGLAPVLACSSGEGDDGDGTSAGDCADILAGDLVITEVMANPAGEDEGLEYFEIYNASSADIDANGLTLVYSLPDGSDEETHEVEDMTIGPGNYVALGGADPEALPDFVTYGFGNDLGTLRNGGAVLALRCGDDEVDRIEYPSAEGDAGIAWQLDGALTPDHILNDDPENYCSATMEFEPDMFGSPNRENEPCEIVAPTTCSDEGTDREVVVPQVGDLVISEFMASPNEKDALLEWFEVHATRDVDLNGFVAGRVVGEPGLTITSSECVPLAAGSYALFGRVDDETNGGLPELTEVFDFALVEDGPLFIGVGNVVLDEIVQTPVTGGASTALDPDSLDPAANDDPANWIRCNAPYGDPKIGNTGTPGASNAECGGGQAGTCMDGGTPRAIVPPGEGDILVTEALANPAGTGQPIDPGHEWFELQALASFDLNGLEIGKADGVEQTLNAAECLSVDSGDFIVFAGSTDAGVNGGLPQVDQIKNGDMQLNNSNGTVFVGVAGTVLHTFTYGNGAEGRASQLDPDGVTICLTPETVPYGTAGDLGTPGAANPVCAP